MFLRPSRELSTITVRPLSSGLASGETPTGPRKPAGPLKYCVNSSACMVRNSDAPIVPSSLVSFTWMVAAQEGGDAMP
jgi:hypothetical protein